MARQGKDFELLIEKIEKAALETGAVIHSPGYLEDRITGEKREVDILIEHSIGTSIIKIVIECRDRLAVQDSTWIEQVHTKLCDVLVNKAIVVSSSPFTAPALEKASFYNIEARTYEQVDTLFIKSLWKCEFVKLTIHSVDIISAQLQTRNYPKQKITLDKKFFHDKLFYFNRLEMEGITLFLLVQVGNMKNNISNGPIPDGPPIRKKYGLMLGGNQSTMLYKEDEQFIEVESILLESDFRAHSKKFPLTKISKYAHNKRIISYVVEVHDFPLGENRILEFIVKEDGSISLPEILKDAKVEFEFDS